MTVPLAGCPAGASTRNRCSPTSCLCCWGNAAGNPAAGAWGWSRGGYGALRMLAAHPDWAGPLALFSPALHDDDPLLQDPEMLSALRERRWGLWCGDDDPLRDGADALAATAPTAPDPDVAGPGDHTRSYWNAHTLAMLRRSTLGLCGIKGETNT